MAEAEHRLRLIYLGTPDFAARILAHLLAWEGGEVVGVFTQPDRPCGRGQVCRPPAVKRLALEAGCAVFQPRRLAGEEELGLLRDLAPDLLVVAAYGLILPQAVLDIPRLGAVNVHASLLPRYRGAAPIQRAIMNGDPVTGVTIMQMEAGLDTGPILLQRALAIGIDDTAATLHDDLAELGGHLLVQALEKLRRGTLAPLPQDPERATYAPKLTKADGLISWDRPAREIHDHIRAVTPWPGAHFFWPGPGRKTPLRLTVFPGKIGPELEQDVAPGTFLGLLEDRLAVACRDRVYLLDRIQPAAGKPLKAKEFFCGFLNRCFS